jgi:type VI secretion system protein ImpK
MANKEGEGITLRQVFTPLIARVLLFTRSPAAGQAGPSIRAEIAGLLKEQEALVKRHEIARQDYENARFAVIAWLDEVMLKATHGALPDFYQQWKRAPVQAELYNTVNAGEEFYARLEQLRPSQKEINEIYHLCLCLGFRGRYYDEEQDYNKLTEIRRERAQHLPTSFLDSYEIERRKERITPQPYEVQPPLLKPRPKPPSRLWAVLAGLALVAVLAWIVWPERQCGNSKADPGEQCDPSAGLAFCWGDQPCQANCTCLPEPILDLNAVKEKVQSFECCHIVIANVQNRVVSLEGRVQSEEQRQQVHQAVKTVPNVRDVQDTFQLIPRPFCEVINLLEPIQQKAIEAGSTLTIKPQKGCEATYYRDENLVVDVTALKPLQYVHVDYYVADKEAVAHLVPNPKQAKNFFQDATSLTIGDPNSNAQWHIEPPFGMELVTVITSSQPLLTPPRLAPERAVPYIAELRSGLSNPAANAEVAATYCFITSADR